VRDWVLSPELLGFYTKGSLREWRQNDTPERTTNFLMRTNSTNSGRKNHLQGSKRRCIRSRTPRATQRTRHSKEANQNERKSRKNIVFASISLFGDGRTIGFNMGSSEAQRIQWTPEAVLQKPIDAKHAPGNVKTQRPCSQDGRTSKRRPSGGPRKPTRHGAKRVARGSAGPAPMTELRPSIFSRDPKCKG
jgi:hypothetical protein